LTAAKILMLLQFMTTILIVYTILFILAAIVEKDKAVIIGFACITFAGILAQCVSPVFSRVAVAVGALIFLIGASVVLPRGHTVAGLLALGWGGWGIYVLFH